MAEGIEVRHGKSCRSENGGRCNCRPSYRAHVFDKQAGKLIRKTLKTEQDAKRWRAEAMSAVNSGTFTHSKPLTVEDAAKDWLRGAKAGTVRNRSGDPYKPSAIRQYEHWLNKRVIPTLGAWRLTDLPRREIQKFVEAMIEEGLNPSTVQCAVLPLRAIYRRALAHGEVHINPCSGLEMPAIRSRRDRIVSPQHGAALLKVLPLADRAIWATALYAGLRCGELKALRWEDVDLASGKIHVRRGWDKVEGEITPKSREGRRTVPIPGALRDVLVAHKIAQDRPEGLAFGREAGKPFSESGVRDRARRLWKVAKLEQVGLHECRHTYASMMIAAGVNAMALSRYMGHFSIKVTLDLYGHLMPGNEEEAAGLLEVYLEREMAEAARIAAV